MDIELIDAQLVDLKEVFRPATPTVNPDFLVGRGVELGRAMGAVSEPGRGLIIFGERGVGKTSVANEVMRRFREKSSDSLAIRVACAAGDDFSKIWKRAIEGASDAVFNMDDKYQALRAAVDRVEDIMMDEPSPASVLRSLKLLSHHLPLLVVIDEFDRVSDFSLGMSVDYDEVLRTQQQFADLIKYMSDEPHAGTLVIVGVADTIGELLGKHGSIERSLAQIPMPRLDEEELQALASTGFGAVAKATGLDFNLDEDASRTIAAISQGFPYYAHLLAATVGELAIRSGDYHITRRAVLDALMKASENAEASIVKAYTDGTQAARSHATYAETLLACALAESDHLGYFAARDIAGDLSVLTGTAKNPSHYQFHLQKFQDCDPPLLEAQKRAGRSIYRFANPLMRPYVLMKGVADGKFSFDR